MTAPQSFTEGTVILDNTNHIVVEEGSTEIVDAIDANGESVVYITGGTFVNWNPANNNSEGEGTSFVSDGYTVREEVQSNGDVYYIVVKA